jgi:tRNA (guanine-N7-)-methyltransferase
MTEGQQRAWDKYWPELGRQVTDLPTGPVDFAGWFERDADVVLEIGSGMGEATSELVAASPEVNYVAVEVYEPGMAQLIMRTRALGVDNLRLLRGDAITLLTEHIAPDSLSKVRLYFPDPWPKKKHHKRRIVQPAFASLVASRIKPGGTFHMATDWAHYAHGALEVLSGEPLLRNTSDGFTPRPDWRPLTKFEQRAHVEGRDIFDLIFERIAP